MRWEQTYLALDIELGFAREEHDEWDEEEEAKGNDEGGPVVEDVSHDGGRKRRTWRRNL